MLNLSIIQSAAAEVAQAITLVLGIETEIVDNDLRIIAGTGRYKDKIGEFEEDGNIRESEFYGRILHTGEDAIVDSIDNYPNYHPKEDELSEICCPIVLDGQNIGLIALVAFTREQQALIISSSQNLLLFLKKMASLLASKLAETKTSSEIKTILESIHDGILAIDQSGLMVSCNKQCEILLGLDRDMSRGISITKIWPDFPIEDIINQGDTLTDIEQVYMDEKGIDRRFLCTAVPIETKTEEKNIVTGAVISFQHISDVHQRIYNITQMEKTTSFQEVLGESILISEVKRKAEQIAKSRSTVLITGESGTGKGLIARAIHNAGNKPSGPLITINCGAIPESLLESELFGYQPGAFTGADRKGKAGKFELAHKGTIFLDEIGDFPLHLQVKLLHVLQRREIERIGGTKPIPIDVRVITATNKNLEAMIEDREFREDLYFRLNVIPIHLPPLRERSGDVMLLLNYALEKFNRIIQKKILGFSPEALKVLLEYPWPGNIRELENVVEYAVNLERRAYIMQTSLPQRIFRMDVKVQPGEDDFYISSAGAILPLNVSTDRFQRRIIVDCLKQTGYSVEGKREAAVRLGISESTLYRKLRDLGIRNPVEK